MAIHLSRSTARLLGVGEDTQSFKLRLLDKIKEGFELGFALTWEAGDEGGADRKPRDPLSEALNEITNMGFGGFSSHIFEHSLLDVLKRHVDIAGDFGEARDGGDQLIGPVSRMGIEKADPKIPLDGGQSL